MSSRPDDGDDLPPHIDELFNEPQEEWGAEKWKALALYLLDRLQQAQHRAEEHLAMVRSAHQVANDWMQYAQGSRPAPKRAGRPKKYTEEQLEARQSAAVVLASRHGTKLAAKKLAAWEFKREGLNPTIARFEFERRTKTWENFIGVSKRLVTIEVWKQHGPGLAGLSELTKLGLHDPSKSRRSPKKS